MVRDDYAAYSVGFVEVAIRFLRASDLDFCCRLGGSD